MYQILFEDHNLIALSKNAGVNFHTEGEEIGLCEKLREDGLSLYPVHRLDKMTSGLILFAKSSEVASKLGQLFSDSKIEKYYLALSDRKPKRKQGAIKGQMEKGRGGNWKLVKEGGQFCHTHFFSFSAPAFEGCRLAVLRPYTGRTHQLRVAMKSLGSPIIGDQRYGGRDADRGYLHAYHLKFKLDGEEYHFTDFPSQGEFFLSDVVKECMIQVERPWELNWPLDK